MLFLTPSSDTLLALGARLQKYSGSAQNVVDGLYALQREEYCYLSKVTNAITGEPGASAKLRQDIERTYGDMLAEADVAALCANIDKQLHASGELTTCCVIPCVQQSTAFVVVAARTVSPHFFEFHCAKCEVCK